MSEQSASPSLRICSLVFLSASPGNCRRNWLTYVGAPSPIPAPGFADTDGEFAGENPVDPAEPQAASDAMATPITPVKISRLRTDGPADFIVGTGALAFLVAGVCVCQARLGRRRNRAAPAPSATMPMPAAVVTCWVPCRLWPWRWRWLPAAPAAMATAALNRNRDQSTGLRLSRADMTFFLPDWGAVDGAGWGGQGSDAGVRCGGAGAFLGDQGDAGSAECDGGA